MKNKQSQNLPLISLAVTSEDTKVYITFLTHFPEALHAS